MLINLFEQIQSDTDLKDNLLKFKQELKDIDVSDIPSEITSKVSVFSKLLSNEDPKVRKNAVLILGSLKAQSEISAIYDAYVNETTNYNKASYIKALSELDFSEYFDALNARRTELINTPCEDTFKKHKIEELHELSILLQPYYEEHSFTGNNLVNECVLLTNRNFKKVTMSALKGIPHKEFTAGVMIKTDKLDFVRNNIRTYSELLFVPEGIKTCSNNPEACALELINAGIVDYIFARIDNPEVPLYFRIDYRNKDIKKAAEFERKLAGELEFNSGWKLINSTSNYELELRFIDTAEDKLVILVRFCMLNDPRFTYRIKPLPVSLKPSTAALLMELGRSYFTSNAAILDPFCGCGTMLIEREKTIPARLFYGVDILKDAIEASNINTKAAGIDKKTELVTKDFFEFRHEYKFNEVITDMPFVTTLKPLKDIETLYRNFFKHISKFLERDAKLFIYSRNRDFLRKYAIAGNFKIIAEFEISKMEGSYYYILEKSQP